jgi:hypothetical protein
MTNQRGEVSANNLEKQVVMNVPIGTNYDRIFSWVPIHDGIIGSGFASIAMKT